MTQSPTSLPTQSSFKILYSDLDKNQQTISYYISVMEDIKKNGLPTIPPELRSITSTVTPNPMKEDTYLKSILDNSSANSTTKDVVSNDNYELIMYENAMYIAGTIACSSLIIGAIILSRN